MKRKLLSLALLVFAGIGATQAQIQKGNVMVGGTLSNITLGLNSGNAFSFNLSPEAAWFVKDNVALGAYVNFGLYTAKGYGGSDVNYGVGGLGRYYISDESVNILKHSRFFLQGKLGINGANYANGGSTNGLGIGFGPGLAYFITPNIGLETLLTYDGIVGFGSNTTTSNLNLGLGFQIYLPTSKIKSTINRER